MSKYTEKLNLFEYEPKKDGKKTFNITNALNNNWDKLDNIVANKQDNLTAGDNVVINNNVISAPNLLKYKNITNCILEAPNGVVEFSNENKTATLKQGLKLLFPNGRNADGSLKNFEYTLPEDSSVTFNYPSNNSYFTFNFDEGIIDEQYYYFEQTTEPNVSKLPFVLWYNTSENKMYHKQAANTPFVEAKIVVLGRKWNKDDNGKTSQVEIFSPVNLNQALMMDSNLLNISNLGIVQCAKYAFSQIHYNPNDFSKIGAFWAIGNLTSGTAALPAGGQWLVFSYKYNASGSASLIGSSFFVGINNGGDVVLSADGDFPHYYAYAIRIQEA